MQEAAEMDLSSILKLTLIEEIVAFFDPPSPEQTDVNQHAD